MPRNSRSKWDFDMKNMFECHSNISFPIPTSCSEICQMSVHFFLLHLSFISNGGIPFCVTIRLSRRRRAFPTAAEVSAVAVAAVPCMPVD